jgi:hypothetical protein
MVKVFSSRQVSTPMAGGEASSVNREVMSVKVTSRKRPSLLEETYFEHPPRYNADQRSQRKSGRGLKQTLRSSGILV